MINSEDSIKIGKFKVTLFNFGLFGLDGGSMFGAVPKTLWSKKIPSDEKNRITLATRSLIIEVDQRVILVDCGNGDKWSEKFNQIYNFQVTPREKWHPLLSKVSDIIFTHLHFDHAAGLSYRDGEQLKLTFPKAAVYLQNSNWINARTPNIREKATYLIDHVSVLERAELKLLDDDCEIIKGLKVYRSDGHTKGLQWIEIDDGGQSLLFPSDLMPTSHHLALNYHMGFDINVERLLIEKSAFIEHALSKKSLVVFQHDAERAYAKFRRGDQGEVELVI